MKQRILVVDDSAFIRRVLQNWIAETEDMEVVGVARDGEECVRMAKELRPDAVTLDVEMPVRDGLSALKELMATNPLPVLMVSSVTTEGAELTLKALETGAFDFVTKPQGSNSLQFLQVKEGLLAKLRAAKTVKLPGSRVVRSVTRPVTGTTDKVVVIAASTGGPMTLATLFAALPKGFPAPILIVQHMPPGFTATFARRLDAIGTVPCREAKPGDRVEPGVALVAPGGHHMLLGCKGELQFLDDLAIHGVKPAADHLFNSAAAVYGERTVGLVLTGMGKDGADGALRIRKHGGVVLGEAESSCVVYGMPKQAKAVGGIDAEFTLEEMVPALVAELTHRRSRAS